MEKTKEILTIAGKRVRVAYCKHEEDACERCCLLDGKKCLGTMKRKIWDWPCMKFGNDQKNAYFVEPWIRCSDCALFLGGKCTRPGGECARKAPLSEEIHSLREWAQILATNPDLRAEFDKMCPPQPIQGSIAPEADLEAEISRFEDELHGFEGSSRADCLNIARHFAEWERERIAARMRAALKKMNPGDVIACVLGWVKNSKNETIR